MCLELDLAKFLSGPGLALKAALRKIKLELELLSNIYMLLLTEKGIRGKICHSINRCAKGDNKYMKDYVWNEKSHNIKYWDVNNLIGNKEKQRYIDKSICLLATRFTYYPVRIIKPFYYI